MKLDDNIIELPKVGPAYAQKLKKLQIETVKDLLLHVPARYLDFSTVSNIANLKVDQTATIRAKLTFIKNQYTKSGRKMQLAEVQDTTGSLKVIWFNQPYLMYTLKKGTELALAGKLEFFGNQKALVSPEYEIVRADKKQTHTARLVPVYPGTKGVTSKWLRSKVESALYLNQFDIEEFLPRSVLTKYKLADYKEALNTVHFPSNTAEAQKARDRLAFNEVLGFQIKSNLRKISWQKNQASAKLNISKKVYIEFTDNLPFKLTTSQVQSIKEIFRDLASNTPMNRLLEGDVGAGKTVVAAAACFASFCNGHQSVLMAPTQILAKQHFDTLNKLFAKFKIRLKLITAEQKAGDIGKTDIFIGTHALLHQKVDFDKVALVVIDEQHRFGVEQRSHLIKKVGRKSFAPHILTMTATPIPRTAALTVYGDLDLSTLKELPKGRKKITTWLVPPHKRTGAYDWIKDQIKDHKIQAFVICPLIDESQTDILSEVKAATQEYERLKKIFSKLTLGLLHGKMPGGEKDRIISDFKAGKINILVSTPVVEVGIDVPNATIMLIEGAERFGLAQLHQLRGRVGRGEHKSYCLLFTNTKSQNVTDRLKALQKTLSGFELAELDLKLRGPGEVFGLKQHGFPELKIASWSDVELIKNSKKVAEKLIADKKVFKKIAQQLGLDKIILN